MSESYELLIQLAERCEKSCGPTIVLDLAISNALGWPIDLPPGKFTGTLDGAASLVPEGYGYSLFSDGVAGVAPMWGEDLPVADVECATPALALCAASLRARAGKLREAGR